MCLRGLDAQIQKRSHFFCALTFGQQLDHLPFAAGESMFLLTLTSIPQGVLPRHARLRSEVVGVVLQRLQRGH